MDKEQLVKDIADVLNRHSAENGSDTPDFILAKYLVDCLVAFNEAVTQRTGFYRNIEPDPDTQAGPTP